MPASALRCFSRLAYRDLELAYRLIALIVFKASVRIHAEKPLDLDLDYNRAKYEPTLQAASFVNFHSPVLVKGKNRCHSIQMEEPSDETGHPSAASSPFAGVQSSIRKRRRKAMKPSSWVAAGVLCLVALGLIAFLAQKAFENPLRTLWEFPLDEYYENHASLQGTRFKAELRAMNQLGWKDGLGRLVVFNVGTREKPAVVLIPPQFDTISFETGEKFLAELQVGQGGQIQAAYLKKN